MKNTAEQNRIEKIWWCETTRRRNTSRSASLHRVGRYEPINIQPSMMAAMRWAQRASRVSTFGTVAPRYDSRRNEVTTVFCTYEDAELGTVTEAVAAYTNGKCVGF